MKVSHTLLHVIAGRRLFDHKQSDYDGHEHDCYSKITAEDCEENNQHIEDGAGDDFGK
ncbi:hypothetical protein GW864_03235 [bacterium]|nr:hypothetical protein [bacterium]